MASANDNRMLRRPIRDGLVEHWGEVDFAKVVDSAAIQRLVDARNESSRSANRFAIIALLATFGYFIRLQGLAKDLQIGPYNVSDFPFGLFVATVIALVFSFFSILKMGDSRSFDRQLMLVCEKLDFPSAKLRYTLFPNGHAWGEPFQKAAYVVQLDYISTLIRWAGFTSTAIALLLITISPILIGFDYIYNKRFLFESEFAYFRYYIVLFLVLLNLFVNVVLWRLRLIDRD